MQKGDIFIEQTGRAWNGKVSKISFNMFEYDPDLDVGEGRTYSMGGKPTSYYWAKPREENKVVGITDDILRSFKHGVYHFYIEEDKLSELNDPLEIIQNSDFKIISAQKIADMELAEKCNTKELIVENMQVVLENLNTNHIRIFYENVGVELPPVHNGEIGVWAMQIHHKFRMSQEGLVYAMIDDEVRASMIEYLDLRRKSDQLTRGE